MNVRQKEIKITALYLYEKVLWHGINLILSMHSSNSRMDLTYRILI